MRNKILAGRARRLLSSREETFRDLLKKPGRHFVRGEDLLVRNITEKREFLKGGTNESQCIWPWLRRLRFCCLLGS